MKGGGEKGVEKEGDRVIQRQIRMNEEQNMQLHSKVSG